MFEFRLPDLGEGVHEGEILHWYVKAGDFIKEDEPLVEVETDKAAVTIPSPKGGKVVSVAGGVGDTISVGTVLVVIDESGKAQAAATPAPEAEPEKAAPEPEKAAPEAEPEKAAPEPEKAAPEPEKAEAEPEKAAPEKAEAEPKKAAPEPKKAEVAPAHSGPVPAAPATRRLARELGVDLRQVPATGAGGRVTSDDVKRFADSPTPTAQPAAEGAPVRQLAVVDADEPGPAPIALASGGSTIPFFELEAVPPFEQWGAVEREPIRSIRRKIAHKMVASMTIVPHVFHMDEADVTELDAFRRREKAARKGEPGGNLTLLAFIIKAVYAQLKKRPQFNASIDPLRQEIVYKKYFNVGFAADTPRGLVVPVIPDVDRKSVTEISAELADKAERARDGKLEVAEMRGGTFTITNVGSLGGTVAVPTINYPEVAILGLAFAQDKPVVRDGEIVIRKMLPMTLAFDHRLIDGADAARFMSALVRTLSDPKLMLLDA